MENFFHLWTVYCRSVLEQSAVLWQGSLTNKNRDTLERTQMTFTKLVQKRNFKTYDEALKKLNMTSLDQRRDQLCLQWARKCLNNDKKGYLFPLNQKTHGYPIRNTNKYQVHNANTERMMKSLLIYMQKLLNTHSHD